MAIIGIILLTISAARRPAVIMRCFCAAESCLTRCISSIFCGAGSDGFHRMSLTFRRKSCNLAGPAIIWPISVTFMVMTCVLMFMQSRRWIFLF